MSDSGWFLKNLIIFGVDNNSSVHGYNKKKDILILVKGPTQGLDGTTLTADTQYSINFNEQYNKFCLSLHYNESNSFLFFNRDKSMRETGLYGFSVDYHSADVDDILDIHKYLMYDLHIS